MGNTLARPGEEPPPVDTTQEKKRFTGGCLGRGGGLTTSRGRLLVLALAVGCEGTINGSEPDGAVNPTMPDGCSVGAPADLPEVEIERIPVEEIAPARRPHWGSATHGDDACGIDDSWSSTTFADWTVFRWAGCHETVYYQIEDSVPPDWHGAIDAAFAAWDLPALCSPHWVNIERGPAGSDAKVHVERDGNHCGGGGVWFACVLRDRAASERDQHWWMNINDAEHPFGLGVTGAFDVQSLVSVELAHIHYLAHMPGFDDSVSQLNNCVWGRTECTVTAADSCGWSSTSDYIAQCDNCGERRELLPGDLATLHHLYGASSDGCARPGEVALECEGCCGENSCGYQTRTCSVDHRWSAPECME